MSLDLRLQSGPSDADKLSVVPLETFKQHARIRHNDEDALLQSYLLSAYEFLSGYDGWLNGYCLLASTYQLYLPSFADTVEIPLRPTNPDSVAVQILGGDGAYTNPAAGSYIAVQAKGATAVGVLDRDAFLRTGLDTSPRAFRLTFTAGHNNPADIPWTLKQAMMMLATDFYANRESTTLDTGGSQMRSREVEYGLRKLAGRFRFSPDHA